MLLFSSLKIYVQSQAAELNLCTVPESALPVRGRSHQMSVKGVQHFFRRRALSTSEAPLQVSL